MKKLMFGLILMGLVSIGLHAEAITTVPLDRICNANLRTNGHGSYNNGMCITCAQRISDGKPEDLICWYAPGNDAIFTAWVGGSGQSGLYSGLEGSDGFGSCGGGIEYESMFSVFLNRDTVGSQQPTIVYDSITMGANSGYCDCSCPIPDVRDGVWGQTNLWTTTTEFENYSQNLNYIIHGSRDSDKVWTPRSTFSFPFPTPDTFFYGAEGDDQMVSRGQTIDIYNDADDWGIPTGSDTIWCDIAGNGNSSTTCGFNTKDGADYFWAVKLSTRAGGLLWDLNSGVVDRTTPDMAPQVVGDEGLANLPPLWPTCTSWVQPGVPNGRWPGIQ